MKPCSKVYNIPELRRNFISLGTLEKNGVKYTAEKGVRKISKVALVVLKGVRQGSLYILQGTTVTGEANVVCKLSEDDQATLWHMRLGHMSEKGSIMLSKRGVLGKNLGKLSFCDHCVIGKQKRVSFTKAIHSTKGLLDYIHSDIWGPSRVPSSGGKSYMLTFVDDFSRTV